MLVLPELNALIGVWPAHLAVEADVRDMPGIWVSADHQVLQCTLPSMRRRSLVALFIILYSSAAPHASAHRLVRSFAASHALHCSYVLAFQGVRLALTLFHGRRMLGPD